MLWTILQCTCFLLHFIFFPCLYSVIFNSFLFVLILLTFSKFLPLLLLYLTLFFALITPTLLFLFHISLPQAFYPSISQLKPWFKDCFNHFSNSGGREQEFTGAWMSFIALRLWSKALSSGKAHPSIIHGPLQCMENGPCEYPA